MDLKGEYRIAAPPQRVWEALNDPDSLKAAIPGCESLTRLGDNAFEATATAAVGPVKARFKGKVTLENLDPPKSYTLRGEGQGGAAGFAKGEAQVVLTPDGDGTLLSYTVKATIGGKLAQIGQRLIDGAAKKMADEFFARFSAIAAPAAAAQAASAVVASEDKGGAGLSPVAWISLLVAAVAVVTGALLLFR